MPGGAWWPPASPAWLAVFLLMALVETFPLALHLGSHLPYSLHDPGEVVTRLEWERYSALHAPAAFFDGFIFYGVRGAQFLTNLVLGGLPIYLPVATVTHNPLLGLNVAHLVGLTLIGWCAYRALLLVVPDAWAAFAGAAVWAFGLPQLALYPGLEWTMTWWVPAILWLLLSFLQRPAAWKLAAATACLWLTLSTHIYSAFMAAAIGLCVIAAAGIARVVPWRWFWGRHLARSAAAMLLVTLPFVPVIRGYFDVPRRWSEPRSIWHTRFFSAEPLDYLAPLAGSAWYGGWLAPLTERTELTHERSTLFPGALPVALGAAGLAWAVRTRRRSRRSATEDREATPSRLLWPVAAAATGAVVLGVVFSLGPELIWRDRPTGIPLPYAWLHAVFPPVRAMRAVSRFVYVAMAGLAVLSACGVSALRGWAGQAAVPGRRPWLAGAAVAALVAETLHAPLDVLPANTPGTWNLTSPVNAFLKTIPPAPLIFVPVEAPADPWPESRRMYWAVTSGPFPLVNGSSAIYPATYWDFERLADAASPDSIGPALDILRANGVRYVAVERSLVVPRMADAWACAVASGAHGRLIYADGNTFIADLGARPPDLQIGFDTLEGTLRGKRVPADAGADLLVDLSARNPSAEWTQESVPEAPFRDLALTWRPAAPAAPSPPGGRRQALLRALRGLSGGLLGGPATDQPFTVHRLATFPTFLGAGEHSALTVHSFTPPRPGSYQVSVDVDGQPWRIWTVEVGPGDPPLKIAQAPGGLAARLAPFSVSRDVFAGDPVQLDVAAENAGRTLWDGQVRLGYRWSRLNAIAAQAGGAAPETRLPEYDGRLFLGKDTAPGEMYRFTGPITTPPAPGRYQLTLSPLAENLIWFDEMTPPGVVPLTLDVTVHPLFETPACAGVIPNSSTR